MTLEIQYLHSSSHVVGAQQPHGPGVPASDSTALGRVVWEGVRAELSLQLRRLLRGASIQCLGKEHPRSNRCKASVPASEAGLNLASPKTRRRLKCEREGKRQAGARLSLELRTDKELGLIPVVSSGD